MLIFYASNKDIVYIDKSDAICLLSFVADELSGFFYIHQSFLVYIQDLHK